MALSAHEGRMLDELGWQLDAEDLQCTKPLGPQPIHARPTSRGIAGVLVAVTGAVLLLFDVRKGRLAENRQDH